MASTSRWHQWQNLCHFVQPENEQEDHARAVY